MTPDEEENAVRMLGREIGFPRLCELATRLMLRSVRVIERNEGADAARFVQGDELWHGAQVGGYWFKSEGDTVGPYRTKEACEDDNQP